MSLQNNDNDRSQYKFKIEDNGERIDRWLANKIDKMSPSKVEKLITEDRILINKSICKNKKTILKQGDEIVVNIPADLNFQAN